MYKLYNNITKNNVLSRKIGVLRGGDVFNNKKKSMHEDEYY